MPVPAYQHDGDAGLDLCSTANVMVPPGERKVVGTGIAVVIPEGFVGLTTPRSGLAAQHGLSIVNTPGVIDSGYRGEIKLILVNHDPSASVRISRGDRVAQLLVVPVEVVEIVEVDELPDSERGQGGFGSTGPG